MEPKIKTRFIFCFKIHNKTNKYTKSLAIYQTLKLGVPEGARAGFELYQFSLTVAKMERLGSHLLSHGQRSQLHSLGFLGFYPKP